MSLGKEALAVVAGPYRYYQVLWLYTQFPEYRWSILLLPYGKGNESVSDLCNKSKSLGIFEKIYISDMIGQDSSKVTQILIILRMMLSYIVGKKRILMKQLILSQTEKKEFDVFFIGCEYSIIEGAVMGLADEKEVYVFEEGLGDYISKKKFPRFSFDEIMSYLVTRMGYFSPYTYFELENTSLCIKYASLPKLLRKRSYREIRPLFVGDLASTLKYKALLNSIYEIPKEQLKNSEIVLFTAPWDWGIEDKKYCLDKMRQWLTTRYRGKHIAIKKHPRDQEKYEWNTLKISFLPSQIPAEIMAEYLTNKEIVMMGVSTTILSLLTKAENIKIIQFDNLHGEYERNIEEKVILLNIEDKVVHL